MVKERAGEKVRIDEIGIDIGGGKKEYLDIHKGDDPHELAVRFRQKHRGNEE